MFIDAGVKNGLDYTDNTDAFEVICVGHAINDEENTSIERPNGLPNYQLFYIEDGITYFKFDDEFHAAEGKTAILFKPGEPQIYKYLKEGISKTYWLHFSGNKVENLIDELELTSSKIIKINDDIALKDYFQKVIYELQNKSDGYACAANSFAQLTLIELSREAKRINKKTPDIAIENLCKKMNTNYYENISNEEYAMQCNMSTSHFLSKFKAITKTSPQNYILNLRISNAQNLLLTTDYKIHKIAQMVGFNDSMYFCKRFKKIVGMSPGEYRKQNQ